MPILSRTLLAGVLLIAACGRPVDLKQALQVTDLTAGYHDAGITDGKNKLVPSITFQLKKSTNDSLRPLSVNVAFKKLPRAGVVVPPGSPAEEDWDEVYIQNVPFDGNQTAALTVTAKAGFTGDPGLSRAEILKHSLFQDVRAHIFAKHSSSQWVEIGAFDIPRQVLAQ
ncbi:MAG TPA: hypothetical protein VNC21_00060 [Vicinamibacterales bacterium]|jgi:hypothetical protein|nr:hypothetical protein [Vicinamibacterales bacterium]